MDEPLARRHYLLPGTLFVPGEPYTVTTVLGSCVAVCLWDPVRRIGGIAHYLLALWNGEGLPTPRFGNIAILRLVERLEQRGSRPSCLQAKVFGGASIHGNPSGFLSVGERNVWVAMDQLAALGIPVVAQHVGGSCGRKLVFHTRTGEVWMRLLPESLLGGRDAQAVKPGRPVALPGVPADPVVTASLGSEGLL